MVPNTCTFNNLYGPSVSPHSCLLFSFTYTVSISLSYSTSYVLLCLIYCCLTLASSGVSDGWRGLWHVHVWCAPSWWEGAPFLSVNCSAVWPWCSPFHFSHFPKQWHSDWLQHGWFLFMSSLTDTLKLELCLTCSFHLRHCCIIISLYSSCF